jgi:hypothetical protein
MNKHVHYPTLKEHLEDILFPFIQMWLLLWLVCADGLAITSRSTVDLDFDGYIDAINFAFNAPVDDIVMDEAVRGFAFTIAGYFFNTSAGWVTGETVDDETGYVLVEEGVSYDTGVTPGVLYDSTIVPGLAPETAFVTALDRAGPIVVNATIQGTISVPGQIQILSTEFILTDGLQDAYLLTPLDLAATIAVCGLDFAPFDRVAISVDPPFPRALSPKLLSSIVNVETGVGFPPCSFFYFNATNHNLTGTIQDAAGNVLIESFFGVNTSTTSDVILVAAGSIDADQNGYIDGYRAMFNMPMADACIVGDFSTGWFGFFFTPAPDTLVRTGATTCDGYPERANTDQFWCVQAIEDVQGGYNTDLTGNWSIEAPTVSMQATGWVSGGSLNNIDFSTFGFLMAGNGTLFDWAAPVLIQVDTYDSTSSGYIDTVVLSFTEPVRKNSTMGSDWTSQDTFSVTIPGAPIVPQTASQLVFSLAPAGQTLNTLVPAIRYNRYKPNFTDLNDNPIERRTPLLFEVPVIQSARGRVGTDTLTLHFTYSVNVTLTDVSFIGDNEIIAVVSDGRDTTATLLSALTQDQLDSALVSALNTNVSITALTTTVHVNQNQTETDVLPASALLPTAAVSVGCAWRGDINALFVANDILSGSDFNAVFRFFQVRINSR